ncbi:hypothetical protein VP01_1544g2 [Puccinia sorghi]|uniref:Post-SET domain-containing protein n=1 Tax=Puccinia sorghi TaxID=27349 RepID=A0A0L6VIW7_9BASI|nr:hypothetical protein VP01_1544g2 [Puccinia sorghi]
MRSTPGQRGLMTQSFFCVFGVSPRPAPVHTYCLEDSIHHHLISLASTQDPVKMRTCKSKQEDVKFQLADRWANKRTAAFHKRTSGIKIRTCASGHGGGEMSIELHTLYFPDRFQIVLGPEGSFASKLISLKVRLSCGRGASKTGQRVSSEARGLTQLSMSNTMIKMTQHKAYTSVQFEEETAGPEGRGGHFELNSELVYINHSCEPNVAFELPGRWSGLAEGKWRLRSLCDIKKGDTLAFAYFSTEWDMAQPFQCQCGSNTCVGMIRGAKYMSKETLNKFVLYTP